jgi:hypothetical protein
MDQRPPPSLDGGWSQRGNLLGLQLCNLYGNSALELCALTLTRGIPKDLFSLLLRR